MRNLRCISRTRHPCESPLPCTASAWDTINDAIIYTLGPSIETPIIELRRVQARSYGDDLSDLLASWDAPCPLPELECDRIVNLQYLVSSETTCLVLAGGDIVIVRSAPLPEQERIEIVGSVDAGITAAAWAPDEDLLAIATRADTLLYMTAEFDNVASATFASDDAKLSKQVSVGWGKRETQFQGKRAKALRDPTVPEHVDEGLSSPHDDGSVSISWRGDGAFVAVNTARPQARRMIRVYSREGALDSVSEAVDGLEAGLAWKPSGQLIAGVRRQGEDKQVVFFERNGLRHGEFSLRIGAQDAEAVATQISLAWNVDSTVLAVGLADRVQLWTMGNYHYYLKQEISLRRKPLEAHASSLRWHPETPLRVLLPESFPIAPSNQADATGDGNDLERDALAQMVAVSTMHFTWTLPDTPTAPPHDLGMMLVIDGCLLRISPLRLANVPPPMALHEITLPHNVLDVSMNSDNTRVAALHQNSVTMLRFDNSPMEEPIIEKRLQMALTDAMSAQQISFDQHDQVFVLVRDLTSGCFHVRNAATDHTVHVLEGSVNSAQIFPSVMERMLHIVNDAHILSISRLPGSADDDRHGTSPAICRFPSEIVETRSGFTNGESTGFGLTQNGILYANQRVLMRNCTSFLLTQSHLIATTSNHMLKFVHLNVCAADLEIPLDEPETDERCRNIERGAKLVAVMPSTYAITLQMPRGNLETVYPRALVLAGIRRSLDAKKYRTAFLACRNHRVDMNIIHDYKPKQFLENVPLIISQLAKVEYIDLYLSQLREEDVSVTLYRNTLPDRQRDTQELQESRDTNGVQQDTNLASSKINRICDSFLVALQDDAQSRLHNIITANVCKSPPDIEAGLTIIAGLGNSDSARVETAVEHICFLTDVHKIYETALGMYNLDLALAVAQQSQKDPREYLPYLQNLQTLNDQERSFQIDDVLKRYSKALAHLQNQTNFDRFLAYTSKHELYATALDLNKYNDAQRSQVLHAYADFLLSRNRFTEAAVAFESLSLYAEASTAFASAQMWRESLSCAYLAQHPTDAITDLAESLVETLIESKSFAAAATILIDHLNNIPHAARTYCKGHYFSDAIRLLASHNLADSISEIVDVELAEAFSALIELISDCRSQLVAQLPRIHELREKKARDPLAFYEGSAEHGAEADVPDNVSLAPSEASTAGGTLLTRYTGRNTGTVATGTSRRTSKNRRREERKRARGKKGSVYEEEYLVNSVGRLIERVNETQAEVQSSVEAMCRRGMWERARALQNGFKELVEGCEKCVPEVWKIAGKEGKGEENKEEADGERPLGADGVLWDSLEEAKRGRTAPTVKTFAGTSLLSG